MARARRAWWFAILLAAWPAALQAQNAPPAAPAAAARELGLYWTIETDMGNITCKLYEKEAPITVRTMVGLSLGTLSYKDPRTGATTKKRLFDGLTFHRVIPGFMIQGGDPLGTGEGAPEGPGFPYKNEYSPQLNFNGAGRLAMANAGPNTNGSQFFITEAPAGLPATGYTIWGQCENLNVVRAIARVTTTGDRPNSPPHIKRVVVERVGPTPANAPEAMPAAAAAPAARGAANTPTAGPPAGPARR
jgi:peptidyl-prolyl cis-trans isomerase A (cyclophilin A)